MIVIITIGIVPPNNNNKMDAVLDECVLSSQA